MNSVLLVRATTGRPLDERERLPKARRGEGSREERVDWVEGGSGRVRLRWVKLTNVVSRGTETTIDVASFEALAM